MLRLAGPCLGLLLLLATVVPAVPPAPAPSGPLAFAQDVLEERAALAAALLPPEAQARLAQVQRSAATVGELEAAFALPPGAPQMAGLADAVARWQAAALGVPLPVPPAPPRHAAPGEALAELALRHGAPWGAAEAAEAARLDAAGEPLRGSLVRFLDAFLAFEDAARTAYPSPLLAGGAPASLQGTAPRVAAPAQVAALLAARQELVRASLDLPEAAAATPEADRDAAHASLPGLAFVDLRAACNSDVREVAAAVVVDACGDDTYANNAGGAGIAGNALATVPGLPAAGLVAAALVDFGGDDTYAGRGDGRNGGGSRAAGFLLDLGGRDRYLADGNGANGAGDLAGLGFLLDAGTEGDEYRVTEPSPEAWDWDEPRGANGGGSQSGLGALLDLGGDDAYLDRNPGHSAFGANGGGWGGLGFLVDGGGSDRYVSGSDAWGSNGANGGADAYGVLSAATVGFLYDRGEGADLYDATGGEGVNGGGYIAAGFLWDDGGADLYLGGKEGSNGGGDDLAAGFLFDGGGDDRYDAWWDGRPAFNGLNGGAVLAAVGILLDLGGDDWYRGGDSAVNGGAFGGGLGLLRDRAGNDRYEGGDGAVNGGSGLGGWGELRDEAGDDTYLAGDCGTNGGVAAGTCTDASAGGRGLLRDLGGRDRYEDAWVACDDCSVAPKGVGGEQRDEAGA